MRKLLPALAALVGAAAVTAPAGAAVQINFIQGAAVSSLAGFSVIDTFNDTTGISNGLNYQIQSADDAAGAPLPQADSAGSSYLTVKADGFATIKFAPGTSGFAFEWGSLDTYNTLEIFVGGRRKLHAHPRPEPAQRPDRLWQPYRPDRQRRAEGRGHGRETFAKIRLSSSTNSFEIDNLAVQQPVPEASTWAMMIFGLGAVGASMRRKKVAVSFA